MNCRNEFFVLRIAATLLVSGALVLLCLGAIAQPPGPGGPPPNPEKAGKIWEMQAKMVAQDLALSGELVTKLVDAYKAARESQMASMRANRKPGERPDFRAMQEAQQVERGKLETALKSFLNPEQTAKALATLGTLDRRWDRMVAAIDGMNLDEKVKAEALKLVANHVAETGKNTQAAMAANDFDAVRTQNMKSKEKIDADLAKVLSPEQLEKWKEATAMRGGPGGPGGQRGGPPPAAKPAGK